VPETPTKIAPFDVAFFLVIYLRRKHLKLRLVQSTGTTLTTDVVQSTQGHVRSDVKFWPIHVVGQFLHQNLSISVEHIHKILQHFEVESWSKQLAVGCPTLPCRTAIQTACAQTQDIEQQNLDLQWNLQSLCDLAIGANVPSDNDESNDGYVAALEIENNWRVSDGAEYHFKFPYPRFKPPDFCSIILK